MGKNKQKAAPNKHKSKKQRTIGPRRNNRMIYLNQAAPAFRKIKKRRKQNILNRLGPIYERVNQSGKGLASSLAKTGIELGTKALGSKFGKKNNKQNYWQYSKHFSIWSF